MNTEFVNGSILFTHYLLLIGVKSNFPMWFKLLYVYVIHSAKFKIQEYYSLLNRKKNI